MTIGKLLFPLLTLSDPDDRHGKDAQCGGSHKQTRPGEGTRGPAEGTHSVWEGSRRVPGDEEARLPSVLLRVFSGPSWHSVQRKPAPAGGKVRLTNIPLEFTLSVVVKLIVKLWLFKRWLMKLLLLNVETVTVDRHLTKLFDSMAKLKFVPGEVEGHQSALGMFAKDGEYVEFNHDCDCSGPVPYPHNNSSTCTTSFQNIVYKQS